MGSRLLSDSDRRVDRNRRLSHNSRPMTVACQSHAASTFML